MAALVGFGAKERRDHERLLRRFSPRIVVTGTRGKSSVTRLVRAGLAGPDVRVVGKTTGTLPRLIHPNGDEEAILRRGSPNVLEQLAITRRAVELGATALVVECMALQPENHFLFVDSLAQPTHTVVTNVRPDHLDVMGPTTRGVAETLASVTPLGGKLFVPAGSFEDVFRRAAADRNSELVLVPRDAGLGPEQLARFSYVEHAENVALALAVTDSFGVPRDEALERMQRMRPDPGALFHGIVADDSYRFVSAFAANDPESTLRLWGEMLARFAPVGERILIANCRADRLERSLSLGRACAAASDVTRFFLVGEGTGAFGAALREGGVPGGRIVDLEGEDEQRIAEALAACATPGSLAMGIGNIGGVGLSLTELLLGRNLREIDGAPR